MSVEIRMFQHFTAKQTKNMSLVDYQSFLITLICLLMKELDSKDKNVIKNS